MKKIKIMIAVSALMVILSQSADAQQGTVKLGLNYNYSIPTGSFKSDLISNNSPRGWNGEVQYYFTDKLSGGLSLGYQDFYQKYPRAIYPQNKTQDVSAVLTNSIEIIPILVKAKYFPLSAGSYLKPYVSLGAGVNIVDFKQYLGEFGSGQTNAGFDAQGGLGLIIPFNKFSSSGIDLGAKYNYAAYNRNGYHDLNSLNFHAGVVIGLK
jgi:outer membrane protein W